MTGEEIRDLWSRFLAGQDLSAREQQDLVAAMDADSQLRESLLENLQLDGILRSLSATRQNGEAFARNLSECLGRERDATRFIQKVELRLTEPPPPTTTPGNARPSKPSTTRRLRRRAAASAQGETAWKPWLVAAAAFIAILLLVADFNTGARRPFSAATRTSPRKFEVPPESPREPQVPPPGPESPRVPREMPPIQPRTPDRSPEAPVATPTPRPDVEKPNVPPAPPSESPKAPGTAVVAAPAFPVIDRIEGAVYLARNKAILSKAAVGAVVLAGQEVVASGVSSAAGLKFEDGTRVDLGGQSSFAELPGRRLSLPAGSLRSVIVKQPADRPLVFVTPHAEATILGTAIRLTVDPRSTILEVEEGKVRFKRLLDGKIIDVPAGHFAVASGGIEFLAQKSFPDEMLIKFGPYDLPLKAGQYLDLGDEFTAERGYGWKGRKVGAPIPGIFWRDPATGQMLQKRAGRLEIRRAVPPGFDPLKSSDIVAGWAGQTETWSMPLPNGRYYVAVCCGDYSFEQGPHHVAIEGVQIVNEVKNKTGPNGFVEREAVVEVKDGELTMVVGGNPSGKKSSDGSTDTLINYLIIRKLKK